MRHSLVCWNAAAGWNWSFVSFFLRIYVGMHFSRKTKILLCLSKVFLFFWVFKGNYFNKRPKYNKWTTWKLSDNQTLNFVSKWAIAKIQNKNIFYLFLSSLLILSNPPTPNNWVSFFQSGMDSEKGRGGGPIHPHQWDLLICNQKNDVSKVAELMIRATQSFRRIIIVSDFFARGRFHQPPTSFYPRL